MRNLASTSPAVLLVTGLSIVLAAAPAKGQSVGYGASPGRASYRPAVQWNNGPYYTAPHVNPYAPHGSARTSLYAVEPLAPPWSTEPHGLYPTYFPGRGELNPYVEGFSPYSGYSPWYARAYGVEPDRENVRQARTLFFRSAPRPPDGVLPPLPPASPVVFSIPATNPALPSGVSPAALPSPGPSGEGRGPATLPVYRSSVSGSR